MSHPAENISNTSLDRLEACNWVVRRYVTIKVVLDGGFSFSQSELAYEVKSIGRVT